MAVDEAAPTKKILTLLEAVGEEYREAIHNGKIARPIEYDEAKAFLEDARRRWESISVDAAARRDVDEKLQAIDAAMTALHDVEAVRAQVNAARQQVMHATGVESEVFPPQSPSFERGRMLFVENCSSCHGEGGDGRGENAAKLSPPPANFTDPLFMDGETPYDFFHVITLGKRTSAMPAWGDVLSLQERWDLVSYLWTLAPGRARLAEGQGLYLAQCAGCHGAGGDGRGPWASSLLTPVRDLTQLAITTRRSNLELVAVVAEGVAATAMPPFERSMDDEERRKVVSFLRVLSLGGMPQGAGGDGDGASARGGRVAKLARFLARSYEQAFGGDPGSDARELAEARALADQLGRATTVLASPLANDIAEPLRGAVARVQSLVAATASIVAVTEAAEQAASLAEASVPPTTADAIGELGETESALEESTRLLEAAVAAYANGDAQALGLASDAYFAFEPVERHLGGVAPQLKAGVEEKFVHLRQALKKADDPAGVRGVVASIQEDYAAARLQLKPPSSQTGLFFQAAAIILREGFEIVLVIGALLGYVAKAGYPEMIRFIHAGTIGGVVASLITAFAFGEILRMTPGSASVLEAATMLLASMVLFWVSYWLVSKAEADRWQRYIRSKVHSALEGRRRLALVGAAFLAVYREGFETVLFYQALLAGTPQGETTIALGIVAGLAALAVVYVLFKRLQVRLPIGQFFLITGVFLYAMAAIFAAQGVYELQEIGWIPLTSLPWMPTIPLLGIFPTLETALVQAAFLLLLTYAAITIRERHRRSKQDPEGAKG